MGGIFVYGAGGHGKVVVDALEASPTSQRIALIVDDDEKLHGRLLRSHRIGSPSELWDERGIVAIGDRDARVSIAARFRRRLITVVHPRAYVARGVEIGAGSVVLAGAVVSSDARVGENVIINTGATVDHDCVIGTGVHIAPGCHLCGNVQVGAGTLLGLGTIVTPGVRIGRNVFVRAGSRVTRDVSEGETVRAAETVS